MLQSELERVKAEHPELASRIEQARRQEAEEEDLEEVRGGNKCVICEFFVEQLLQRLGNNATEEEIKEEVEHACEYLPKTVRKPCENLVETYGDMIIQYLTNSADPQQLCTELGLCDDGTRTRPDADVAMGKCQLCMVLSDYLSAMLEDPRVDTSIDEIVEKICPVLPAKYRKGCKEMIEDYGPYLMSLLAQATDKGKACATLSLC
jgi:saposin